MTEYLDVGLRPGWAPPEARGFPPTSVWGRYRLTKDGIWQREVHNQLLLDGVTPERACMEIAKRRGALVEAKLRVEPEMSYGDPVLVCEVVGWSVANAEEREWIDWQLKQNEKRAERARAAEIETFRKKYPDMIKET